ncbi:hypothetical protein HHI36_015226 [Cryptolaemus montrouzieri]|uniref:Uncharacterized protein n=1 Tax=Cryptolaemus montrouzieri TaxID=559131 RepID=A0ABD2N525_9CUCU
MHAEKSVIEKSMGEVKKNQASGTSTLTVTKTATIKEHNHILNTETSTLTTNFRHKETKRYGFYFNKIFSAPLKTALVLTTTNYRPTKRGCDTLRKRSVGLSTNEDRISLYEDRTEMQRFYIDTVRDELKVRTQAGEQDIQMKFLNGIPSVVKRKQKTSRIPIQYLIVFSKCGWIEH